MGRTLVRLRKLSFKSDVGFGVDTEDILTSVNPFGYSLTDVPHKYGCRLASGIEPSAADEVGQFLAAFLVETIEKVILTVDMKGFCRYSQSDDFEVGELGNDTSSRYIAEIIYTISSKFLAYIENSIEICNEVAHRDDDGT